MLFLELWLRCSCERSAFSSVLLMLHAFHELRVPRMRSRQQCRWWRVLSSGQGELFMSRLLRLLSLLQSRVQHKGTPAELYYTLQQFRAQVGWQAAGNRSQVCAAGSVLDATLQAPPGSHLTPDIRSRRSVEPLLPASVTARATARRPAGTGASAGVGAVGAEPALGGALGECSSAASLAALAGVAAWDMESGPWSAGMPSAASLVPQPACL